MGEKDTHFNTEQNLIESIMLFTQLCIILACIYSGKTT